VSVLVVNAVFLLPGRVGGAEQAGYALIRGLSEAVGTAGPTRLVVLCAADDAGAPLLAEQVPDVEYVPLAWIRDNRFVTETAAFARRPKAAAVLHLNYFAPPTARAGRTVTFLHDAQFRHLPANFSRAKRTWLRCAHTAALQTSDVVAVPSGFVRDHLLEAHPRARADVRVLGNAVEWDRFDAARTPPAGAYAPYVVASSAAYPHKNLGTLFAAFARYRADGGRLELRTTGQATANLRSTRDDMVGSAAWERAAGLTEHGFVSADERTRLLAGSRALLFPSLYEGFGLPPVEALGLGRPVVTTSLTSIPEVSLGLASYIGEPTRVEPWVDALWRVERGDVRPPTVAEVAAVRAAYDHRTVGERMLDVLLGPA
jgi:glycosyltransferase involved in cell wall biosynthesis